MTEPNEFLIILDDLAAPTDALGHRRVTQRVSSRVVVIEQTPSENADDLRSIAGVRAVLAPGDDVDRSIRESLSPSETLFVDAFSQRATPKERPGEGLDWDALGFLPPDPPKKR